MSTLQSADPKIRKQGKPRLTLRQTTNISGSQHPVAISGSFYELLLDGEPLPDVRSFKFEVVRGELATAQVTFGQVGVALDSNPSCEKLQLNAPLEDRSKSGEDEGPRSQDARESVEDAREASPGASTV